jgi:metal-responsive CopG/Arc/MetJ family transcriptional regulator
MTGETNSQRVVITLPAKLREKVEKLAKKEAISMSAISRRALRRFFEQCGTTPK